MHDSTNGARPSGLNPSDIVRRARFSPEVLAAVTGRRSVRSFLDDAVDDDLLAEILAGAARAPSGQNMQPWHVHIVRGEVKNRLSRAVLDAAGRQETSLEYAYLPEPIREPYLSRRRKVGFDLHSLYGIARGDLEARTAAYHRNFTFYGAPVGLFFVMDRDMALGSWIDCGMFMQNVMILARAAGLETCPQQAWCDYGATVHEILSISQDKILLSGMAIGYEDTTAAENGLRTERLAPIDFTTKHM